MKSKDKHLIFRTSAADRLAIRRVSQKRGLSVSGYIRSTVQRDYEREFGTWPPKEEPSRDRQA